jgi:hypothetical protein
MWRSNAGRIKGVTHRSIPSLAGRLALWAFAAALLLKAVMPLLAGAAAHLQGKSLVEICTVYGVRTIAVDNKGDAVPSPAHQDQRGHGSDHCALIALTALGTGHVPEVLAARDTTHTTATVRGTLDASPHDVCATWMAQRQHGPPAQA